MMILSNRRLQRSFLLVLHMMWLGLAQAQTPAKPAFREEMSKQEGIYQSKGEERPAGYTIERSLDDYLRALPSAFDFALSNLSPKDRWLDIGAGRGHAILDYHTFDYDLARPMGLERRGTKARAVAVSIEDRRADRWQQGVARLEPGKIQYFFSKPLEEYALSDLGKFQVITDVIGGFSYASNLSVFVEKALSFLELNGSFFTLLQDVHSEAGVNSPHYKGAPFLTQIAKADGSEMKVCAWLKSITCVEVTCEFTTSWTPPIESYRVRKVCENVVVPALVPMHYQAGTPPERRYQLGNTSVAAPAPASPAR